MMMKTHHQQAVDMAKIELEQGKSAELRKMAQKIIDSQKKEIAAFDEWLQKHKWAVRRRHARACRHGS